MKNLKNLIQKASIALLIVLFYSQATIAQETKVSNANSQVTIYGTSNIHDWDMKAEKLSGAAVFKMENGKLTGVDKLNFSVEVESLKSGKGGMDKNTYNALNSKSHKNIIYTLTKVNKVTDSGNNTFIIETTGNLKIAGETKSIPIKFTAKTSGNKTTLSGKVALNMTHYKVDPPKALMGTIKTGEEVTIDFQVIYN